MKKFLLLLVGCVTFAANAQVRPIEGVVTSEADGSPISGVVVLVEGSNVPALTNAAGEFTIKAEQGDALLFNMLGYVPQRITVGTDSTLAVVMMLDATLLDDVVVIGYGTQKKSVVTAAISSVKSADLESQTPARLENMLQGKIAGVTIVRDSGQPGAGTMVRIRGVGTYNNSNPLYVIDGMQMGSGDGIDQINPADIESMEILKDAASAAIYGTRGANGVILITTKKGRSGDARVTYDAQWGWQNPWKHRDMLSTDDYITLMKEGYSNQGLSSIDLPYQAILDYEKRGQKIDTDWQKELFYKNAPVESHQMSVSGASDRVNYYVSAGYFKQAGIVGGNYGKSNYDRLSLRTNTTYKLMDKSKERDFLAKANLGVNATYAHTNSTGFGNVNGVNGSILYNALAAPPIQTVYALDPDAVIKEAANQYPGLPVLTDDKGRVFNPFTDYGEVQNPLAEMYTPTRKNWADKFVTSFWADLELYKGLTLRSSYGVDMAFWGYNEWNRPYWRNRVSRSTDSSAGAQFNRGFTWQLENTLNYVKTIDRHNFTVLLGQSARANRNSTNLTGSKKNLRGLTPGVPYPYEDKAYINFSDDAQGLVSGGPVNPYRIASYFGRLSYNFDERYMLEATLRRDGSTRFGANNRWAYFPSVSAGWNITNEEFAKSLPGWVSNLKLRASWGQNGNDSINDFSYTANMGYGNPNKYIWGADSSLGVYKVGAQPSLIPNPDLMWEASEQIDLGLEAGLFKNSLNLSIDWYQKNTKQMLLEMSMPQYVGNSLPKGNLGNMYNSGIELEMSYNLVRNNWSLGIDANATYLKNRLESLGNASGFQNIPFANDNWGPGNFRRDENGYPFHYFWGRKTDGIFQNQAEVDAYVNGKGEKYQPNAKPGDVRFVDVTGDGLIDDKDKTMIGNYFPTWAYSFTISASWKSFDMSAFWQGVADVDIFDYTRRTDRGGYNQPSYWMGRWHGEGTSNSLPKYTWLGGGDNDLSSDLYVQNGAYLRLKSLQVGYTIPEHISKRVLISRLRVYFMAENLLTFTGYRGFDPEVNEGVDSGLYPQPRTLSVGLNLTF